MWICNGVGEKNDGGKNVWKNNSEVEFVCLNGVVEVFDLEELVGVYDGENDEMGGVAGVLGVEELVGGRRRVVGVRVGLIGGAEVYVDNAANGLNGKVHHHQLGLECEVCFRGYEFFQDTQLDFPFEHSLTCDSSKCRCKIVF